MLPSKIFQINIGDGCIQFNVIKIHFLFSSDTYLVCLEIPQGRIVAVICDFCFGHTRASPSCYSSMDSSMQMIFNVLQNIFPV